MNKTEERKASPQPETIKDVPYALKLLEILERATGGLGSNKDLATKLLEQARIMLETFHFKELIMRPSGNKIYVFQSPLEFLPGVGKEEVLISDDVMGIPNILVKTLRRPTEGKISHTEIAFLPEIIIDRKPRMSFWQANWEPKGKSSDMEIMQIQIDGSHSPVISTYDKGKEKIRDQRASREKAFEKFLWPY